MELYRIPFRLSTRKIIWAKQKKGWRDDFASNGHATACPRWRRRRSLAQRQQPPPPRRRKGYPLLCQTGYPLRGKGDIPFRARGISLFTARGYPLSSKGNIPFQTKGISSLAAQRGRLRKYLTRGAIIAFATGRLGVSEFERISHCHPIGMA